MKKKSLMNALLLCVLFFLVGNFAVAQDSAATSYDENARADSVERVYNQQQNAKEQSRKDSENLSDLKSEKREAKAKAKEAQRIEDEATDAARESKLAYRKEKQAQKAREQADKQLKKAEKARRKSDKN
jgi:cell shape-determining protein MreC